MGEGTLATFIDGNEVCAGCSRCCRDVQGLMVSAAELERVPLMKPHVTRRTGPFQVIDMPEGCPYLLADGRCGVFDSRPFDCSLYPVHVSQLRPRGHSTEVTWRYGGTECPQLEHFKGQGVSAAQLEALQAWAARAQGARPIVLRQDRSRPGALRRRLGWCDR